MDNIQDMMKAAQQASDMINKHMEEAQYKLDLIEVEGVSGGGLVKIRCSAKGKVNELGKMLPEYYAIRGWDSDGQIKPETRERLGL